MNFLLILDYSNSIPFQSEIYNRIPVRAILVGDRNGVPFKEFYDFYEFRADQTSNIRFQVFKTNFNLINKKIKRLNFKDTFNCSV